MSDGFLALYHVGRLRPHLTILDIYMPIVDGIEAVQAIRADPSNDYMAIFVVTGGVIESWPILTEVKNLWTWQKPVQWQSFRAAAFEAVSSAQRVQK